MFTSIRKYNVRRGSAPELARRVQDGFVPLVRQIQGFRGYYVQGQTLAECIGEGELEAARLVAGIRSPDVEFAALP